MKKRFGVTTAVAALMMLSAATASAKSGGSVVTVPGPCATEWTTNGDAFNYPLEHPNGNLSVNMKNVNGVPTLVSVCVEPGWTVQNKGATDGVQLEMSYNGRSAIDFKYVLGKTDIRYR